MSNSTKNKKTSETKATTIKVMKSSSLAKKPAVVKTRVALNNGVNNKGSSVDHDLIKNTSKFLSKSTVVASKRKLKKSTHPEYGLVTAEFPDGEVLEIMTTYGQNIKLDISPRAHPAWAGGQKQANIKERSVAIFNKKWGNLPF